MTQKVTKQKKLIFSWMLAFAMVLSIISPGSAAIVNAADATAKLSESYSEKLEGVTKYLKANTDVQSTYSYGFEWRIMQQARQGKDEQALYKKYLDSVDAMVKEGKTELLTNSYATLTIALTAIGADPTNVGGKNLLEGLADYSVIEQNYASTIAYALIALDSNNYDIPSKGITNSATREKLVKLLVSNLDSTTGMSGYTYGGVFYQDIDTTAQIIQALAPYYKDNKDVKSIVDKALASLSKAQATDGTFGDYDQVSTTSQVICALTALGINPEKDSRFIKNGVSTVDAVLSYYDNSTGAITVKSNTSEYYNPLISCEQAGYALVAYDRLVNKKTSLYDMSDVDYKLYTKLTLSKPSIKKATSPKKKQIKVTWKKKAGVTGYEIQVSTSSKFKKAKSFKVKKDTTTKTTIKKSLKSGKKYFVRMRSYKTTISGNVVNSSWSAKKTVRTK